MYSTPIEPPSERTWEQALPDVPAPEPSVDAALVEPLVEPVPEPRPAPIQCTLDARRQCYTGPQVTADVGECSAGVQFCQKDGSWTACQNQITPVPEVCDGKDNDCNGQIDDGLKATLCRKQRGVCQGAMQRCDGAKGWRLCEDADYRTHSNAYEPIETQCDGKDNDCDGVVDQLGYTEICTIAGAASDCGKGHYVCQQGQRICRPLRVAAPREICGNQIDDDCNGVIDDPTSCPQVTLPVTPSVFDVLESGELLFVTSKLEVHCLKQQSNSFQIVKKVALDPTQDRSVLSNWSLQSVRALPKSKHFVVFWTYTVKNTPPPWEYHTHMQIFDASCNVVGKRQLLTKTDLTGTIPFYDVAVAADDTFVVALKTASGYELLRFDAGGTKASVSISKLLETASLCIKSGRPVSVRVSLNDKGQGVAACSVWSSPGGTVLFRRFDLTTMRFTDRQYNIVKASQGDTQSLVNTSLNDQGAFVLSWDRSGVASRGHAFFDASGTSLASLQLDASRSYGRIPGGRLGADFIWGDKGKGLWYRYTSAGKKLTVVSAGDVRVRSTPKGVITTLDKTLLKGNAFSLTPNLCGGKACLCTPYEQQECTSDAYVHKLQTPCRQGRQLCLPDGTGWASCQGEVLRTAEQCDDKQDNDCDGQIDDGCTDTSSITPPELHAFGVTKAGDVVALHWNALTLMAHCYRPDRSVKRGFVKVTAPLPLTSAKLPFSFQLRVASANGMFLVSWVKESGSNRKLMYRLFDGDCLPVTPPRQWGSYYPLKAYSGSGVMWRLSSAIDETGHFALLGTEAPKGKGGAPDDTEQLFLQLFDPKGKASGAVLAVDPSGKLCLGVGARAEVLLHPTDGTGLVLCSSRDRKGMFYRRFSRQQGWLDAAPQRLFPETATLRADGFLLAQSNSKGALVVTWQRGQSLYASFFGPRLSLRKSVVYGTLAQPKASFTPTNASTISLWGDDFVIVDAHDTEPAARWTRFDSQGIAKQKASIQNNTTDHWIFLRWRDSLRLSQTRHYLQIGRVIKLDPLSFQ